MHFSFLSFHVYNQPKALVYEIDGELKMPDEMQRKRKSDYSVYDIQNRILRRH